MTLENKYIMDQIQHTNGGQRFKLLPGGELTVKQWVSHYPDLLRAHPPRGPFAYRYICCGQMPAISLDKHNCLFSIVTMFELKNLPGAPDGGQTLDKAVPAQLQPHHSCLAAHCLLAKISFPSATIWQPGGNTDLIRHTYLVGQDRRSNNIIKDHFSL